MDAQHQTVVVKCECGYTTPPPECCNGSPNVWICGYYEPPVKQPTNEEFNLANLTGYLDY
jgi:hypothetical protein